MTPPSARPDPHDYFMTIALAVRRRADCSGNRVGAILVQDRRIISTGYNGTPEGMPNCSAGGCLRCADRARFPTGTSYDLCICVHAEQNALLAAARFGIAVEGSSLYTTMRPCFGCTKELLQAKVRNLYWLHDWAGPGLEGERRAEYERIQRRFLELGGAVEQVVVPDEDGRWAVSRHREPSTG